MPLAAEWLPRHTSRFYSRCTLSSLRLLTAGSCWRMPCFRMVWLSNLCQILTGAQERTQQDQCLLTIEKSWKLQPIYALTQNRVLTQDCRLIDWPGRWSGWKLRWQLSGILFWSVLMRHLCHCRKSTLVWSAPWSSTILLLPFCFNCETDFMKKKRRRIKRYNICTRFYFRYRNLKKRLN